MVLLYTDQFFPDHFLHLGFEDVHHTDPLRWINSFQFFRNACLLRHRRDYCFQQLKLFVEHLTCDCSFITHHTVSGANLTGLHFLKRKNKIVAALEDEIKHGDMDWMAAFRRNKRTL